MNAGDTFYYKHDGKTEHLWIVLSDPLAAWVVVANFTTFRGGAAYYDPACVVEREEYAAYLAHRSWIAYFGSLLVSGPGLGRALLEKKLRSHKPISAELLARVRRGAVDSEHTPLKCRQLLLDQGLVNEDRR